MAVATPTLPASTVAVTNTSGQYVSVAITGGTLTNVSVNGVTVGAGAGNYAVPPGGTISITYSVAPTWAWTDPNQLGYTPGYGAENTAFLTGAGYNPVTALPMAQHGVGGTLNLGTGVTN